MTIESKRLEYVDKAVKYMNEGDIIASSLSIRALVESILKEHFSVEESKSYSAEELINILHNDGKISEDVKSKLHKLRMVGNGGAHNDEMKLNEYSRNFDFYINMAREVIDELLYGDSLLELVKQRIRHIICERMGYKGLCYVPYFYEKTCDNHTRLEYELCLEFPGTDGYKVRGSLTIEKKIEEIVLEKLELYYKDTLVLKYFGTEITGSWATPSETKEKVYSFYKQRIGESGMPDDYYRMKIMSDVEATFHIMNADVLKKYIYVFNEKYSIDENGIYELSNEDRDRAKRNKKRLSLLKEFRKIMDSVFIHPGLKIYDFPDFGQFELDNQWVLVDSVAIEGLTYGHDIDDKGKEFIFFLNEGDEMIGKYPILKENTAVDYRCPCHIDFHEAIKLLTREGFIAVSNVDWVLQNVKRYEEEQFEPIRREKAKIQKENEAKRKLKLKIICVFGGILLFYLLQNAYIVFHNLSSYAGDIRMTGFSPRIVCNWNDRSEYEVVLPRGTNILSENEEIKVQLRNFPISKKVKVKGRDGELFRGKLAEQDELLLDAQQEAAYEQVVVFLDNLYESKAWNDEDNPRANIEYLGYTYMYSDSLNSSHNELNEVSYVYKITYSIHEHVGIFSYLTFTDRVIYYTVSYSNFGKTEDKFIFPFFTVCDYENNDSLFDDEGKEYPFSWIGYPSLDTMLDEKIYSLPDNFVVDLSHLNNEQTVE